MRSWSRFKAGTAGRRALSLGVVVAAAVFGACSETLDGGSACGAAKALCPGQNIEIRDTIINPSLEYDSTYIGFPARGSEFLLPLVSVGDSIKANIVVRYDSLTTFYLPPLDTARPISYVDSSRVRLFIDLTRSSIPDSVRIDLYDVDPGIADDTASAPVLARFQPQYRIGGKTFAKAELVDSVYVPLNDSAMLARIQDTTAITKARLRLGIAVSGNGPVVFRTGSVENGAPIDLFYRPGQDTAVKAITIVPASAGPSDREDLRRDLMDYMLVAKNLLPEVPGTMSLGGLPGRRVYMRLNLPRRITDSSTIIRATLQLTQLPFPFGGPTDTVVINPHIVLASDNVTDNRRAATLIGVTGILVTDSLPVIPRDSGQRTIELYSLVRQWASQASLAHPPPRALVLSASNEGTLPRVATFYSSTANAALRPRMRITYIPKITFGVP
jgi:hypothetical protein